ncbi:MAG TPA: DUF3300 domain-containing protein [Terriglobales bacterium]|nr:DUF3300 domain-containing protein [Terriglobales bacterium]
MKKINLAMSLAVLALLSLILNSTALADNPPDNVQGDWTIYSINIENGETVVKQVQIAQYGNRITGYFEGPDQSGPIQGEVNGHEIRFNTVTRNVLKFSGQIYGNSMNGSWGLHGKHSTWQAVRTSGGGAEVPPATVSYYQNQQPEAVPPAAPAPAGSYQYSTPQAPTPVLSPEASTASASATAAQSNPYPATGTAAQGNSYPTPAPLSSDQLDSLVAPIALYPDALVAQVLAAAANPDQVAYADDWLSQNKNLTGSALAQAVDQQSWDPSVKALTQFPSVLDNMAHNLSWTSSLGQAFANQQSDVMAAVQAMRAKAQAAGTLQSNSQITVTTPSANTIVIQPANPQVVYVPQYNPTVVYGAPVVVPYYLPPPVPVASVGLFFGSGVTIGAAFGGGGWGGGFGWGWHAWGVNWGCCGGGGSTTIIYNHNTYINNHTWNNTNYNGYHPWANGAAGSQNHAWYGNNGTFHPDGNYKPGEDTHYGPNGAYHPNGYFGPDGGWHADKGIPTNQQPNGGNNGNHGLIGGNGGVQHAAGPVPTEGQPNGGRNGDHGLIGGNGGVDHGPDGGRNGNGGLIGGNGGVQRTGGNQMLAQNRSDSNRFAGADQNRSRFSGNGAANRMESNRGRASTAGRRPQQHMARDHAPAQHRSGGGGGRRR